MYLDFYGLKEAPFSITPDPRFVCLTERHRDALAHLLYGIGQEGSGGFLQLTGEVGTGKTTLSRLLLEQLPENTKVALLLNPNLTPVELLETLCEELGIRLATQPGSVIDLEDYRHHGETPSPHAPRRGSSKDLVDALNAFLLEAHARGQRIVLLIDEAQNLSIETLEQVRLLTNLETAKQKLLQVILLGQPELRDKLALPELRQLAQRVTARYHLTPLDETETEAYLRHRFRVAGAQRFVFTRGAVRALHRASKGIPRLLNIVADRALLAGYVANQERIDERLVRHAAWEVSAQPGATKPRWRIWVIAVPVFAASAMVGAYFVNNRPWQALPQVASPAPLPVPAPPQPPVLSALIRDASAQANAQAWQSLREQWSLPPMSLDEASAARCPLRASAGASCLRASGMMGKLAMMNRPVLLVLQDRQRMVFAHLIGLNGDRAQIRLAGSTWVVGRTELEGAWLGDYIALWTHPVYVPDTVRLGETGPAAAWIKEKLERFDGRRTALGPALFDAEVEDRVRRLQIHYGLLPDGIVGPETLFVLSSLEEDGPHLKSEF